MNNTVSLFRYPVYERLFILFVHFAITRLLISTRQKKKKRNRDQIVRYYCFHCIDTQIFCYFFFLFILVGVASRL